MARKPPVNVPCDDAVIYARYSSHSQNDASIEQQVAECREYAQSHNLRIIDTYADRAISGRSDKRPEFQKMMRAAETGRFRVVLAYKSNRIARNMLNALAYEDRLSKFGIRVVYAKEEFGDNAAGRFALRTMMNVNQFYSENMAEDIKRGLMDSAMQCKIVGPLSFGFCKDSDGKYAIHPQEAPVVREIFQRLAEGDTEASIERDLNARGICTKTGGKWGKNSLHRLVRNERYIGIYVYKDLRIDGGVPAIVDKELFDTVNRMIDKRPTKINGRHRENSDYLLTGKLFCGHCGSPMIGVSGTSKTGSLHFYYTCQKRRLEKSCKKKTVRRDWVELMVAEALKAYVLQEDTIEWIADMVMDYARRFRKEDTQIDYYEAKLAESKKASQNILKAIEAGIFNSQTQERMLELEAEQRSLHAKICEERALIPDITREQIVYWLQSFRNGNIENAAFRAKLFDSFLMAVYLYDDHVKIVFSWDRDKSAVDVPISATDDGEIDDDTPSCVRIEPHMLHQKPLIFKGFSLSYCFPTAILCFVCLHIFCYRPYARMQDF